MLVRFSLPLSGLTIGKTEEALKLGTRFTAKSFVVSVTIKGSEPRYLKELPEGRQYYMNNEGIAFVIEAERKQAVVLLNLVSERDNWPKFHAILVKIINRVLRSIRN